VRAAGVALALVLTACAHRAEPPDLPKRVVHSASGIALVLVPAGELLMGSPQTERDRSRDEKLHRRVVPHPFYLGETEVTHRQFRAFVEATGYLTDAERGTPEDGHGKGAFAALPEGNREWSEAASWRNPFPNLGDPPRDDDPVVHVSWNDARAFVTHHGLRLPAEAEWEHGARGGTRSPYFWGEDAAGAEGFANVADAAARRRFPSVNLPFPFDDGFSVLAPVGRYRPNPWGLHDMVGNVEEWCQDVFAAYPRAGADASAAGGEGARVVRGAAWLDPPGNARSAHRAGMMATSRRDFIGFRVAMDAGR
jgi:serine/threonine-protein kinase PpkA